MELNLIKNENKELWERSKNEIKTSLNLIKIIGEVDDGITNPFENILVDPLCISELPCFLIALKGYLAANTNGFES